MITTAKTPEVISIPQNKVKLPNSPTGAKIWCTGEVDGLGNTTLDKLNVFNMYHHVCNYIHAVTNLSHIPVLSQCVQPASKAMSVTTILHLASPAFNFVPVPVLLPIAAISLVSRLPSGHLYHPHCHSPYLLIFPAYC